LQEGIEGAEDILYILADCFDDGETLLIEYGEEDREAGLTINAGLEG